MIDHKLMNLILIIPSLNPGGAQRVLTDLANYWVSRGHQVTLVTLDSPSVKPFYPLDACINLIQLDQSHNDLSPLKRLKNVLKRLLCLRKTVRSLHPDIIISFIEVMNIMVLMATLGLEVPVIISERTNPFHYKIPKFYQKLRLWFYPKAFKVVVQTESAAGYFKRFSNLIIFPNPVTQPVSIKKLHRQDVQEILSSGRLCPFKGFDTLIYAFSDLIKDNPDLHLTIYGEGPERSNLETLIKSLDLQGKVTLPGVIKEIHEALTEADLFIFPSLYEGFPNALCEAMAVGLPVIASNCSGNVNIIRDGLDGRLFPVGQVKALRDLMHELINDCDQRQRLSNNAKMITQRFAPEIIFSLWDKILLEAHTSHFS